MLLVFLLIGIGFIVGAIIYGYNINNYENGFSAVGFFIGGLITATSVIVIIIGIVFMSEQRVIDRKIEMYIEENTTIEANVTATVEKYLEHEFNIFDSLQGEDIQTLLVVYPEINSNELVKKQVEIFVENNNKIKELKENELDIEVWKWWVYFG